MSCPFESLVDSLYPPRSCLLWSHVSRLFSLLPREESCLTKPLVSHLSCLQQLSFLLWSVLSEPPVRRCLLSRKVKTTACGSTEHRTNKCHERLVVLSSLVLFCPGRCDEVRFEVNDRIAKASSSREPLVSCHLMCTVIKTASVSEGHKTKIILQELRCHATWEGPTRLKQVRPGHCMCNPERFLFNRNSF